MDLEKDMFKKMAEVQEAIAPKHIAKHTMEDDIGMVHELTQVRQLKIKEIYIFTSFLLYT